MNLSDVLFDTCASRAEAGRAREAGAGLGHPVGPPGLKLEVEGHADSRGSTEYNQELSERRPSPFAATWGARNIPSPW